MDSSQPSGGGPPLARDVQEGQIGGFVRSPDALETRPVFPAIRQINSPEPGIFSGLFQGGLVGFAPRPGRPGRFQFPDLAPIIAAL